jgi:hypothetical protein
MIKHAGRRGAYSALRFVVALGAAPVLGLVACGADSDPDGNSAAGRGGTAGSSISGGSGGKQAAGKTGGGSAGKAGAGGSGGGSTGGTGAAGKGAGGSSTGGTGTGGSSTGGTGGKGGSTSGGSSGDGANAGDGNGNAGGAPGPTDDGLSPYTLECNETTPCTQASVTCLGIRLEEGGARFACSNDCDTTDDCSDAPSGTDAEADCVQFTSAKHCVLVCYDSGAEADCPDGMGCYRYPNSPIGYCLWL